MYPKIATLIIATIIKLKTTITIFVHRGICVFSFLFFRFNFLRSFTNSFSSFKIASTFLRFSFSVSSPVVGFSVSEAGVLSVVSAVVSAGVSAGVSAIVSTGILASVLVGISVGTSAILCTKISSFMPFSDTVIFFPACFLTVFFECLVFRFDIDQSSTFFFNNFTT